MAIKDQCEQCKKYNSTCIENIEFNGQSCDHYIKRINLEKKTNLFELGALSLEKNFGFQ